MTRLFSILLLCCAPWAAWAHGGGVDPDGCHTDRDTGEVHCHSKIFCHVLQDEEQQCELTKTECEAIVANTEVTEADPGECVRVDRE